MDRTETVTELHFEPPAPGSWELDAIHFPRPVTRYWAEFHPESGYGGHRSRARRGGLSRSRT